jgi:hypothetical protein
LQKNREKKMEIDEGGSDYEESENSFENNQNDNMSNEVSYNSENEEAS